MTSQFQDQVFSFIKPTLAFLRSVIDGPNPSAPYSWIGTVKDSAAFETANSRATEGYETIC